MEATYISINSFSIESDKTLEFLSKRRLQLNCGLDGIKYAAIVSSSYATETVVVIDENVLTSNLIEVLYGVVKPGTEGNLPDHFHSTTEGDGGYIIPPADPEYTLLDLTDTPTTYSGSEGQYLQSTGSGTVWVINSVTDGKDGATWLSGIVTPPPQALGVVNDYYLNTSTYEIYKKDVPAYSETDVFTGGTASVSDYDSSYIADNVFDNSTSTMWHLATSGEEWVKYDFGAGVSHAVSKINVYPGDSNADSRVKAYVVYGSNDDIAWDNLTSGTLPNTFDHWHLIEFINDTQYRYIRFNVETSYQSGYIGIMELEAFTFSSVDWQSIGNIQGADGQDGSYWLTASGIPTQDIGEPKDLFLDLTTYDFYIKDVPTYGATNLFDGAEGTPTASSVLTSLYGPERAVDGSTTGNSWFSASPTSWWKYEFLERLPISKLSVMRAYSKDFEIYGSNDDSDWTLLTSGTFPNVGTFYDINFTNSVPYSFIRVNILNTYTNYAVIQEIRAYQVDDMAWRKEGNISSGPGDGDSSTFIDLIDTPSTYSGTTGLYAQSTGSGIVWTPVTVSGGTGSIFSTGFGTPNAQDSDFYIEKTSNTVYERTVEGGIEDNTGVLLIHSDTTNGATSFIDSSTSAHLISVYGNPIHSTDQQKFGASSIKFSGADYLLLGDSDVWDIGTADFTYDLNYYPSAANGVLLDINTYTSGIFINWFNSTMYVYIANAYGSWNWAPSLDDWYHVAVVRESGVVSVYIDGTALALSAGSDSLPGSIQGAANPPRIGYGYSGSSNRFVTGYLDEIRLVNDTALWSENFIPLTRPYTSVSSTVWEVVLETTENFTELLDTPSTYSGTDGKYLRSTGSGTVWSTVSGSTGTNIFSGALPPTLMYLGEIGDFYIATDNDSIYEKSNIPAELVSFKSVVVDIAENYGEGSFLGIRSIEFKNGNALISLADGDITCYATTEYASTYYAKYTFITDTSKTLAWAENQWLASNGSVTNQRLICVFNTAIEFNSIVINNSHNGNGYEISGAKNIKIYGSTDEIVSTVYDSVIPNSVLIFADQLAAHSLPTNTIDDQILSLTLNMSTSWVEVLNTKSNFIELDDTPTTYSGGQYLRTTASGIEAIDGIIMKASNDSEWLIQVTNSGTLYTTAL